MKKTLRAAGAGLLAAAAALAFASPAGAEPAAVIDDISLDGCDIVVTFTVGDAGTYHVTVWDDGSQIGDVPVAAAAAESQVVGRYTLTSVVQQGASGLYIGIDSDDGSTTFDSIDPYNGADDVIDFCASQNPEEPAPAPEPEVVVETNAEPQVAVAPAATPVPGDPGYTG